MRSARPARIGRVIRLTRPVMPVERAGFALRPFGFFDANPSLDMAPPSGHGTGGS